MQKPRQTEHGMMRVYTIFDIAYSVYREAHRALTLWRAQKSRNKHRCITIRVVWMHDNVYTYIYIYIHIYREAYKLRTVASVAILAQALSGDR